MSDESGSIWQALLSSGEYIATDADYEHGYDRRIREDLVRVVTFRVGDEHHAIPIRQVREITRCFQTTPVPRTSDYITGVGTLRGELVPVLCLATRLGMRPGPVTRNSRIVLVTLDANVFGDVAPRGTADEIADRLLFRLSGELDARGVRAVEVAVGRVRDAHHVFDVVRARLVGVGCLLGRGDRRKDHRARDQRGADTGESERGARSSHGRLRSVLGGWKGARGSASRDQNRPKGTVGTPRRIEGRARAPLPQSTSVGPGTRRSRRAS